MRTQVSNKEAEFTTYLASARERVNRALAEVLNDYLDGVDEWLAVPIRYACEGGGKRFRPILFLASYEVSGRPVNNRVDRLASALEIVHSYSLVHDDLPCMDDDDWRRGRATCHRAYGDERATVAAAAMVPLAGWVMAGEASALGFTAEECAVLVRDLSRAAGPGGMVGGQLLDLISEGVAVTGDELGDIHQRKTGALIRESARLGGMAGQVGAPKLEALTLYGEQVGFAFQIADDLLDETRAGGAAARDARSDQELEKATYPAVYGTARAETMARALTDEAIAALRRAGIQSPTLERLAVHVVEREN